MSLSEDYILILADAVGVPKPQTPKSVTFPPLTSELQDVACATDSKKNAGMQSPSECCNSMSAVHSFTAADAPSQEDKPQHAEEPEAECVDEDAFAVIQLCYDTDIPRACRPSHLVGPQARKSTEDLLKVTVPQKQIKMQSFTVHRMQQFLNTYCRNATFRHVWANSHSAGCLYSGSSSRNSIASLLSCFQCLSGWNADLTDARI